MTETASIFIPQDALGDRECKPGEKLTFTVQAVDAETKEVEAKLDGYAEEPEAETGGVNEALDELPE